jgi:hypothetical protein
MEVEVELALLLILEEVVQSELEIVQDRLEVSDLVIIYPKVNKKCKQ